MPSLSDWLTQIQTAIYGEEVRNAIVEAILANHNEINDVTGYKGVLTSSDDLNDIYENGFYTWSSSSLPKHTPSKTGAILEVFGTNSAGNRKVQRVTGLASSTMLASRTCLSSTWEDWNVFNNPSYDNKSCEGTTGATNDTLSSGGYIQLLDAEVNLRKGEKLIFKGNLRSSSSFNSLIFGWSPVNNRDESNAICAYLSDGSLAGCVLMTLSATSLTYARYDSSGNVVSGYPVSVAHGLTIANNVQVIFGKEATANMSVTIISNGQTFTTTLSPWMKQDLSAPFVKSVGSTLDYAKLSWTCSDIQKGVWLFGDSYMQYSSSRWTYYLHTAGYDNNVLIDALSGGSSGDAWVSFKRLLKFGTPRFALWGVGMNNSSDESSPADDWMRATNNFLNKCADKNITPILATIPTITTKSHEQKNAWIRSSGYRYIDFARALGANANGNWFDGMKNTDGVHTAAPGAQAMFGQALADFPELMIENF